MFNTKGRLLGAALCALACTVANAQMAALADKASEAAKADASPALKAVPDVKDFSLKR